MDLPWMIVFGVVCAWAVLRVLGAERERRLRELRYRIAVQAADHAHAAASPEKANSDKPPVRSKVVR
jgi:hypothetical protein